MTEFFQFILGDFFRFAGFVIILVVFLTGMVEIVQAVRSKQ